MKNKGLLDLFAEKDKDVSRRLFLKSCGASIVLAGMPFNLTEIFAASSIAASHVTLTWGLDPKTTQTIAWSTETSITKGTIQAVKTKKYRKSAWEHAQALDTELELFNTNKGDFNIHFATLEGLTSGTQYTYRVGSENSWSDPETFTTEHDGDKAFKFLVFGDSQSGLPKNPEYGPWRTTIHNAYAANQDAAFFMNVGDLVEIGQDQAHWKNWYEAAQDVIEKIPNMAVPGNHETYDVPEENHSVLPLYFKKQLHLPKNGPDALKGQVYSFDYGNTHFAVLDSQEQEEGQYVSNMLALEAEWLDKDLSATNKKWKIVLFHKTPYYNKAFRSKEKLKAILTPIMDKHHVDLVINGHDHGYSRTYPIYQDSFVSTPGQGTIYLVAGRSGNKYYTDLSAKVWDAFFHDPQAEPNYITIEVAGDVLTIRAYTQSGNLIDTYSIDKLNKTDVPLTILPEKSNDTRLVIWGNMLQNPLVNLPPQKISDVWYLPLRSFVEFIGGEVTADRNGRVITKYKSTEISFTLGEKQAMHNNAPISLAYPLTLTKGTAMIAADDVKTLWDFHYRFDQNTNMLMLAK
ncbi:MAG: metallophosphoesterase [Massilibacillus sp.]|nr:metallophosphoesterase [Massilibacillus sp.]